MPLLDSKEFLNKKDLANLYCFYGEERYLVDHSVKVVKDRALGKSQASVFNFEVFYPDCSREKLLTALNILPLVSSKKVVVIKQVEEFPFLEELKVENPNLILILVGQKIDKRKSFFKHVLSAGVCVEFNYLNSGELERWMVKKFKNIKTDIARSLIQRKGSSMYALYNEISKISDYEGCGESVDRRVLDELTPKSTLESVFKISEYLVDRDRVSVLSLLNEFLRENSSVGILALISRHFRILLFIKLYRSLPRQFGVPSYFYKKYESQSGMWDARVLKYIHGLILETDYKMKSSHLDPKFYLVNFILKATSYN